MIFIGLFHRERVYLAMSKGVNQLQNCLKKAVTCIIIIIIVSMVSSTTSYTVIVSYRRSTLIRYQKSYMLVSDRIYI